MLPSAGAAVGSAARGATAPTGVGWSGGISCRHAHSYKTLMMIVPFAELSRVVFAAYNNLDRWLQPQPPDTDTPLANTGSRYRVTSRIVSASINEPSEIAGSVKLTKPVEFILQHTNVSNEDSLTGQ